MGVQVTGFEADGVRHGEHILHVVRDQLSPEALAIQPFKKIEGTRKRELIGRMIKQHQD